MSSKVEAATFADRRRCRIWLEVPQPPPTRMANTVRISVALCCVFRALLEVTGDVLP